MAGDTPEEVFHTFAASTENSASVAVAAVVVAADSVQAERHSPFAAAVAASVGAVGAAFAEEVPWKVLLPEKEHWQAEQENQNPPWRIRDCPASVLPTADIRATERILLAN